MSSLRNTKGGARAKATVVTLMPKLGEELQQIPRITSKISLQERAVLGTAKMPHRASSVV